PPPLQQTGDRVAIRVNGQLRIARREIREQRALEPVAYDFDVITGELLHVEPLFFTAKAARIFDPNPVAALNDPSLRDHNDAASAVPESAYRSVMIGNALVNEYVMLTDLQDPRIAPPTGSFEFNRQDDGFEDVNAFVHITRVQELLHSLGYAGPRTIAPYAIPVDAHAINGTDNSYYLPAPTNPGYGTLYFGEGGTDDAEDADLVVHEYGHALLDWIAPGTFSGSYNSQARALSEAFCDYLAFSQHYDTRIASGRDPFCFADWDARCAGDDPSQNCGYAEGADCLRRLDSTRTMREYEFADQPGVEHRNGQIWSSALRELFLQLGKRTADTLILESLFGTPATPSYATIARQMIAADRILYGGVHVGTICDVMSARGIFGVGDCDARPRGEFTLFQSPQRELAMPDADPAGIVSTLTIDDARMIEELRVRVDIRHASRGDLRITLIAPDGTEVILLQPAIDRAADLHTTFGRDIAPAQSLDALRGHSAAGTWRLRVADIRTRDLGALESWGLEIRFAGDEPLGTRPDVTGTFIPVVAHLPGQHDTFFQSDVRLLNRSDERVTATLIFTPSESDGHTSFAAANVTVAAHQLVVLEDIVRSLFATEGSGSLQIVGNVLATSRTYTRYDSGTVGELIPAALEEADAGERLVLVQLTNDERVNLGITNVRGSAATVHIAGLRDVVVPPYSHAQLQVASAARYDLDVLEGRVVAYASIVKNTTGDSIFIPAVHEPLAPRDVAVPTIHAPGAGNTMWDTTVWRATSTNVESLAVADGLSLLRLPVAEHGIAGARIGTDSVSQFVPFAAPSERALQFIPIAENNANFRTNLGAFAFAPSTARFDVHDSSGAVIASYDVFVGANEVRQLAVTTPVTGGYVSVHVVGAVRAWASVVDNATADAIFVPAE
ncbi:MAG TPA: proprotein convertase P-domain-containing protein, partial [Thermoanaerobaculia bacterium]|nr:proprotein convertase P-domain-containing protein [Thermoanaerobaculia bacterium]